MGAGQVESSPGQGSGSGTRCGRAGGARRARPVGLIDGRTVGQSLAGLGGGTLDQLIATLVIVFLLFFPYFAFRSLAEVLGKGVLSRLFFVDRRSRSVTD